MLKTFKSLSLLSKISAIFLVGIVLVIIFSPKYLTLNYLSRVLYHMNSDIDDYKYFPSREIKKGESIFNFEKDLNTNFSAFTNDISYKYNNKQEVIGSSFEDFLSKNQTSSFIVVKDDKVIYENYFNGYSRDSVVTSLSMAKSFASTLIGIAIEDGYIKSVDDPITVYIPELKRDERFEKIRIKDLLNMSSGIKYKEGMLFFGDDARTYYSEDLKRQILEDIEVINEPGKTFLYNNYNPQIIGMIIERSTNKKVSDYLSEKLWSKIGMEFHATWTLDSENGFEKMESGINARAIDFAKFGRLFLKNGNWNGDQIISESWIKEVTSPHDFSREFYKSIESWNVDMDKTFYKYFWWIYKGNAESNDYYARGKYGQFIYISPSKNMIIVRNGMAEGEVNFWPEIFYQITQKF